MKPESMKGPRRVLWRRRNRLLGDRVATRGFLRLRRLPDLRYPHSRADPRRANRGSEYATYHARTHGPILYVEAIPELAQLVQQRLDPQRPHFMRQALMSDLAGETVPFHVASNHVVEVSRVIYLDRPKHLGRGTTLEISTSTDGEQYDVLYTRPGNPLERIVDVATRTSAMFVRVSPPERRSPSFPPGHRALSRHPQVVRRRLIDDAHAVVQIGKVTLSIQGVPAQASASTSASTMRRARSRPLMVGFQPSFSAAFEASQMRASTSAGRR